VNKQVDVLSVMSETLSILDKKNLGPAEYTSSYSNILEWRPHPRDLSSARSCIIVLFCNSIASFNSFGSERLIEQVARVSYFRNYDGDWLHVREISKLKPSPGIILQYILTNICSTNDWFGNYIKDIVRCFRGSKYYNPYIERPHKVKSPQRKRGYDDKGTLRPSGSLGIEYYRKPKYIEEPSPYKFTEIIVPPVEHITTLNDKEQGTLVERSSSLFKEETLEILDTPCDLDEVTIHVLLTNYTNGDNPICKDCKKSYMRCFDLHYGTY